MQVPVEPATEGEDRQLMAAIADRDVDAFQNFYRKHCRIVYSVCLRITGQDHDAEDVVSDVFWELWEKSARYNPSKSSPFTYLIMLTRCRALDKKRGQASRRPKALFEWMSDSQKLPEGEFATIDEACRSPENQESVRAALRSLEPNQRQAIEVAFFEGLTHRETADKLGLPLGTVKGRIRSALGRLRQVLRSIHDD